MDEQQLKEKIIIKIKEIFDPEIPVNIYDLGLIYEIKVDNAGKVDIRMTLTSPNCPVAETLPAEVHDKVEEIEGVTEVDLVLTFDPPWDKDMMSDEAMLDLGLL